MAFSHAQIYLLSFPAFSTLVTGFWIAQLGLNPGKSDHLIYHNCAPRQDDPEARRDNEGEGLTYALLSNGVKVVGVFAGYTLSFRSYCSVTCWRRYSEDIVSRPKSFAIAKKW